MLKNLGFSKEIKFDQVILENINKITIPKLKIKKSSCAIFLPQNDDICFCGLPKVQHENSSIKKYEKKIDIPKKWDPKTCITENLDTDAYGEIHFQNRDNRSKYIRVGQFTKMEKMMQLLFKVWSLEPPKLIISVTGGAKDFNLKTKLKNAFKRGLVKAALSTNAWITSGGTNVGVMKYVGEAIASASLDPNRKLVVLGIANWGTLANREQLIRDSNTTSTLEYTISSTKIKKNALLDMNHSHFVLVDNGLYGVFGGEVKFRAKLERQIANYRINNRAQIVVLVLSGGENTISTVLNSVKNGSPCVFIEGSGGCADFFAFALSRIDENAEHKVDSDLRNELINKSQFFWPNKSASDIVDDLEDILNYPHLLSTFRLDSAKKENEIDVAILRSLLKTQNENSISQLSLALTWNRIDIAKDYILTDEKAWEDSDLYDLMFTAISTDKPDFVEIFMENNCDISKFLTYRRLLNLYNNMPKNCIFYKRLIQIRRIKAKIDEEYKSFSFQEIEDVIESLLDNLFEHSFSKLKLSLDQVNDIKIKPHQTIDNICVNPYLELFIYSILTDKAEMANLFWNYNNEISSALIAAKVYREYDKFVTDKDETYNQLADSYEKRAVDVIQSCYEENIEDAQLLLLRQIPEFGNSTLLSMASAFECKNFVSTTCFQDMLAKLWYGQIYTDAKWINIFFSIILPLLSPLFLDLNFDINKLNLEEMNAHAETQNDIEMKELVSKDNQIQSKKGKNIGYRGKLYYFFRSPIIKFCYNQIFFIIFLLLFSYIILCNFFPIEHVNEDGLLVGKKISEFEFLLMGWVFVFFLDEIRQLSNITKFKEITLGKFFSDFWNLVQFTSIFLFGIGIGMRFVPDYNFYLAARIILSIDIICWFFCGLHGYSVIRSLGPKLLMIQKMLNELAVFLLIVVVFISAYGISSQSLMYHNQELDLSLLKSVFLPAYFVIGGEYFEREKLMDIDGCHSNLTQLLITDTYTQEDCPEKYGASVSLVLLVVYIMLLNILLVNLLIAIFSNTYENVESEADKIWKFQRYRLVNEYFHRPFLPIPLTVFNYFYNIVKNLIQLLLGNCLNCKFKEAISLNSNFFATSEKNRLKLWESFIAEEYINRHHIQMNNQEQKNKEMLSKFEGLNSKIDRLTEIQNNNENTIKILQKKLDLLVEGEVKKSSDEIQDQTKISKNPLKSIAENNRIEFYPESKVAKKAVPFGKVKWSQLYTEYYPNEYTSENVLYKLTADAELLNNFQNACLLYDSTDSIYLSTSNRQALPDEYREKIKFNSLDDTSGLDRTSCLGNYIVKNGVPLNPKGRQGISGRGSLHFWGPNHFYEIIFSRHKKNNFGNYEYDLEGKIILEFVVAIKVNSKWRFPSIMQEKQFKIDELIEQKLIGEIFDIDRVDIEDMRSILIKPLNITKYYKESSYNTDNAWLEFTVLNYHDQGDKVFSKLKLKDFYDGKRLEWVVANDLTITNLSDQDSKHIKRLLRLHQFSNLF